MGKEATRVRRRERKNIASGIAHVNSSFNNTTITITDAQGNTIAWSSAGTMGFKGSRKSTSMPRRSRPKTFPRRRRNTACARWKWKLPAPVRAVNRRFARCRRRSFTVTSIRDVTTIPHNGCRPRKRRRV